MRTYNLSTNRAESDSIMDAMTLYISILSVSYLAGVIFCVYVNASHKLLISHAIQAAASVWIATLMPEWMIWTSCVLMIISLIAVAYSIYKYELVEAYRTVLK